MTDLYLVTDRRLVPDGDLPRALATSLEGADAGARVAVQLREKDLSGRELEDLARALVPICAGAGALLLVNDRADVARAVGANGVHLPTDGLPPAEVRGWWPDAVIGCSAHSLDEVRAARDGGADFATFGPVWETPSKAVYGPPVGLEALGGAAALGLPLLAIGGITRDRVAPALAAGATGIACIRAVLGAADLAEAVRGLLAPAGDAP